MQAIYSYNIYKNGKLIAKNMLARDVKEFFKINQSTYFTKISRMGKHVSYEGYDLEQFKLPHRVQDQRWTYHLYDKHGNEVISGYQDDLQKQFGINKLIFHEQFISGYINGYKATRDKKYVVIEEPQKPIKADKVMGYIKPLLEMYGNLSISKKRYEKYKEQINDLGYNIKAEESIFDKKFLILRTERKL